MLILVAEDDPYIRAFVEDLLIDAGHAVATTPNGQAALGVASARRPDLILLDMQMPVMDGWAFAQAYRQTPPPHAPIVVMTAARNAEQRAAEIGAAGFLGKPFEIGELVELVERYAA